VFFRPLEHEPVWAPHAGVTMTCVVTGVDRAGIVARVARTLADHGVNITDLHTRSGREPESGTPLYTMRLGMTVPPGVERTSLQKRLERVASELHVDLTLAEAAAADA